MGGRIHAPLAFLTPSAGGHATTGRDKRAGHAVDARGRVASTLVGARCALSAKGIAAQLIVLELAGGTAHARSGAGAHLIAGDALEGADIGLIEIDIGIAAARTRYTDGIGCGSARLPFTPAWAARASLAARSESGGGRVRPDRTNRTVCCARRAGRRAGRAAIAPRFSTRAHGIIARGAQPAARGPHVACIRAWCAICAL